MYITLFMDVEDLVATEADDIAKTCADILAEEGTPATLCLVGEKTRLLRERKRQDVIAALSQHDIGIHTDTHSIHPTVVEYLGDKDWEAGVQEAIHREKPGVEAIEDVFRRMPSCWAGAGNTWGPQICGAMEHLGVSAFVYAHTRVPKGGVHRFNGLIAYPIGRALNDGEYQDDALAEANLGRLYTELQQDAEEGVFWREVFLGHPTRILHEEFWDAPNFTEGANPPRDQWISARRKSQADLDRALVNFRKAARTLRNLPKVEIKTIGEMNQKLRHTPYSALSAKELESVWGEMESNLRAMPHWPILPSDYDTSRLVAVLQERAFTLKRFDPKALAGL